MATTLPDKLECPTLLTLKLEGNQSLSIITASFFQGTKELRVLNLEGIGISSIGWLLVVLFVQLACLNLNHCSELDDTSPLGILKKLEILALRGTLIRELPAEIGELITLRVLDLKPLLEKTVCLNLDCCDELEAIPQHYAKGFVYLKIHDTANCNGIRHLIYSVEDPLQLSAFGQLDSLYGLDNLELFCPWKFSRWILK